MSNNRPILLALGIVTLSIIGLAVFFVMSTDTSNRGAQEEIAIPAPPPTPAVEPRAEVVVGGTEKLILIDEEPVEEVDQTQFVLPLLDASDQLIRDGVVSLSRHEGINAWLAPNELIRKFVAVIDNIAQGQVVKDPVRFMAPEGIFVASRVDEDTYVMEHASFRRYDLFIEIIESIDARRAAEFYQLLRPLFQEAYIELGYGANNFDDVIFKAIGRLLETPVIEEVIRLKRPSVMFEYEESRLESLSPVQKQLVRMGPRNTRIFQLKIAQIATELRALLGR